MLLMKITLQKFGKEVKHAIFDEERESCKKNEKSLDSNSIVPVKHE